MNYLKRTKVKSTTLNLYNRINNKVFVTKTSLYCNTCGKSIRNTIHNNNHYNSRNYNSNFNKRWADYNGSTSRKARVTPIDPESVTNQTLQGYPTKDKNMSTDLEKNE